MNPRRALREARYVALRFLFRRPYLLASARYFGLRFRFRTEDAVGRHIYKRGAHEPVLSQWLLDNIVFQPGDVVFDIGANIGWYSLLIERCLPEGATVYAFEPDDANFALLQENLHLNDSGQVVAVNKAVGAVAETRTLYRFRSSKNLGRHSLLPVNGGEQRQIDVVNLDAFADEHQLHGRTVRFIKIDVEGYEFQALSGAPQLLRNCEVVMSEYSPGLLRQAGEEPRRVLDLLQAAGFVPHHIDDSGLHPASIEALANANRTVDLIWKRLR